MKSRKITKLTLISTILFSTLTISSCDQLVGRQAMSYEGNNLNQVATSDDGCSVYDFKSGFGSHYYFFRCGTCVSQSSK